ncbi:MAG: ATP-binding protein [Brachybacterium sp.]|uniref:AAA family ATPase n=1 Tax=Brachybacterium sp. TaxID=1891286 RepID=UPI0026484EE5|nr:ATP-binding protein [Brachybacterium sp.]MDN5686402.1 ATP-binding protein [Brachybacterium sp.]
MSGTVHLMYGLAGAGKSTLAGELAARAPAVRFTLDQWMLRLYPELTIHDAAYGHRAETVRELIWSIAEQVLVSGTDVVLDWNFWSTARRTWALERASSVAATVILHRLSTSLEESTHRAREREAAGRTLAHRITRTGNDQLARLMEEPTDDEGLTIVEH